MRFKYNSNATIYHEIKVGILDNTCFKENVLTFEILVGWISRLGRKFWVINIALYDLKCDPAFKSPPRNKYRLNNSLFWNKVIISSKLITDAIMKWYKIRNNEMVTHTVMKNYVTGNWGLTFISLSFVNKIHIIGKCMIKEHGLQK